VTALRRSSFVLDTSAFSVAEGLRAGLSVAAIVFLHAWLNFPLLLLTALGALLTCLADAGTPGQERLPPLFAFSLLGALIGVVFGLARTQGLLFAVPLAGLFIFAASFARVYGPAGMQVGNLLSVWIVLAVDLPKPNLTSALISGGVFLAGSLWAIVLTSLIWRIQTTAPFRRSIGDCYRALAAMAQDMREILATKASRAETAARWERNARIFRGDGRIAIETARTRVLGLARARGNGGPRTERAWLRIEAVDQAFGALSGVADLLEGGTTTDIPLAARALRHLRNEILVIAHNIDTDEAPDVARLTKGLGGIHGYVGRLGENEPMRRLVTTITERLAVAVTLTAPENLRPGSLPDGRPALPWQERLLGPIRSNLDRGSAHLRHAAMAGFAATACLSYTLHHEHEYERWLVITLLMTMQPHFSATWQRMLERIGGTVLGGLIASALSLVLHTPLTVSLAMFPLAVIAFTLRKVSYGLFLIALTPMVILLVESGTPGASEFRIAMMRALYTVLGGVFALLCSLALWPGRQPQRAVAEVRRAIAAHAASADAVFAELVEHDGFARGSPSRSRPSDAARRQAGIASNALESALSRSMLEPRLVAGSHLNAALTIDAALRRIAGRLSVIRILREGELAEGITPRVSADDLAAWRGWFRESSAVILRTSPLAATCLLPPRPKLDAPADDPVADGLTRIARQTELIAGAMPKLV
jgi:uncharacterized membrane protein YccC